MTVTTLLRPAIDGLYETVQPSSPKVAAFANLLLSYPGVILDSIIGVGAAIASLGTLGLNKDLVEFTDKHLGDVEYLSIAPFGMTLLLFATGSPSDDATLTSEVVSRRLKNLASRCTNSDNLFKKHVGSRLTYALAVLSCVVTRVYDAVIGVLAFIPALLTLGHYSQLNRIAFNGLAVTGVVHDVFSNTIRVFNPFVDQKPQVE